MDGALVAEVTRLLAIDPGSEESAWVLYDTGDGRPEQWAKATNDMVLERVFHACTYDRCTLLVVEMIASYGMPVGAEVFETCVWIGRFIQVWPGLEENALRVTRLQAKSHICHSGKATDANVRRALIDRWGPGDVVAIGRKATPGPLYGLTGDCWQALAVAVTAAETMLEGVKVAA